MVSGLDMSWANGLITSRGGGAALEPGGEDGGENPIFKVPPIWLSSLDHFLLTTLMKVKIKEELNKDVLYPQICVTITPPKK